MVTEAELELAHELFEFKEVQIRNSEIVDLRVEQKSIMAEDGRSRPAPALVVELEGASDETKRRLSRLATDVGVDEFKEYGQERWLTRPEFLEDHECEAYADMGLDRFNTDKAFFRGRCSICDKVVNEIYVHDETKIGVTVEGDAENV